MTTEYRITETNETKTTGSGGFAPTSAEKSYTIEALGDAGTNAGATTAFYAYAAQHSRDDWNHPIAEGGVQLNEVGDSLGRLWTGSIRWELPTANSSAADEAYDVAQKAGDDGSSSSSGALRWYPYVSSFSVAGGVKHMATSYNTRAYAINGSVVNFNGGIGWDGSGFEGVDVPCPAITFDITARTPEGFVGTFAQFLNKILPFVGTVNSDYFWGCEPGTVLFNGITSGSLKSGTSSSGLSYNYWEMNFNFSAMPNTTINIGGVAVAKGGWEYLWQLADEDGLIQAVYVEQVFAYTPFSKLGLGGAGRL